MLKMLLSFFVIASKCAGFVTSSPVHTAQQNSLSDSDSDIGWRQSEPGYYWSRLTSASEEWGGLIGLY